MDQPGQPLLRTIALLVAGSIVLSAALFVPSDGWLKWACAIVGLLLIIVAVAKVLHYTFHLPRGDH